MQVFDRRGAWLHRTFTFQGLLYLVFCNLVLEQEGRGVTSLEQSQNTVGTQIFNEWKKASTARLPLLTRPREWAGCRVMAAQRCSRSEEVLGLTSQTHDWVKSPHWLSLSFLESNLRIRIGLASLSEVKWGQAGKSEGHLWNRDHG